MRQGDGAQDRAALEPGAGRGLRRQHHRPLPGAGHGGGPHQEGDGGLHHAEERDVRGGDHGAGRRQRRPGGGGLRRPCRHRVRHRRRVRPLEAELLQPGVGVDPERQPGGQDRRLRAGDGDERVLADGPTGGHRRDAAQERRLQERLPLLHEVRVGAAVGGAQRQLRLPDRGVHQRWVPRQVLRRPPGEARRGVPLQDPPLRAEVPGEHHAAGDGPALHHRLPHEADELPLLPDRMPVRVPAVHAGEALRGVPPLPPALRSAGDPQAGGVGGGDGAASAAPGKGRLVSCSCSPSSTSYMHASLHYRNDYRLFWSFNLTCRTFNYNIYTSF